MKRNLRLISKALSLLLALTMLLSVSSTVLAADAVENDQVSMLSGEELLGSGSSAAVWMLEKLAGGAIGAIGGKAMNAVLGSIFGSSSDSFDHAAAAEKFLNAIQGVKDDVGKLQGQINMLSGLLIGKMNYGELKKDLDDFAIYINQYVGAYNDLCDIQKFCANDAELTDLIAKKIYYGEDRNLWVDGKTTYNATIALGNRLVLALQGDYNIFGAFDKMDRYKNRWENQGYAGRKAFRDNLIKIYSQYSAMSKLACKVVYAQADDSVEGRGLREMVSNRWNQLCANAEMVNKMYERCAVVEHPNVRVYRDTSTGTDIYTFAADIKDVRMPAMDYSKEYDRRKYNAQKFPYDSNILFSKDYMFSMTETKDPLMTNFPSVDIRTRDLYSQQAETEQLLRIYSDYQSDYPGKTISMYNIFFDGRKGAFKNYTNQYGPTLGPGAWFATNRYTHTVSIYDSYSGRYDISEWASDFIREDGGLRHWILGRYRFVNAEYPCYSLSTSSYNVDARYYSIIRYDGPALDQGNLKAPSLPQDQPDGLITGMADSYELPYSGSVTLSVAADSETAYQWYLDKGDGNGIAEIEGATAASYTLPALQASMNDWSYQCGLTKDNAAVPTEPIFILTDPVTLNLTGEGVPAPVTEHEVSNAGELETTLDKVSDGTWNGHTIKLTSDIKYPAPITLLEHSVTIDLNGHTLTVQPSSVLEPNINPVSNRAEIAAIYALRGNLYINGDGALNVIAGQGIDYGVYAYASEVKVSNITCTDGGTSVYATDGGSVEITGDVSAKGENAYAIECFSGSTVKVSGDISADGNNSCGVYAESYNEQKALVEVGGNITVSGDNSQAAFLNAEQTVLKVQGNVTVTGSGASGVSAGGGDPDSKCTAIVFGDINAPVDAVNAWDSADVRVHGNVTVTDEAATAVSVTGALVHIYGNITSKGKDGAGISVSAWDLVDPVVGAMVKADGKITAFTPLRMKGMPVEESEHSEESVYAGYYTFADGTNNVWAKPGSFMKIIDSDPGSDTDPDSVSNPQTGESTNSALWVMLGISALAIIVIQAIVVKRRNTILNL